MTAKLVLIHRRKERLNKLTPKWVRKRNMGEVGELKEGTIQSNKKREQPTNTHNNMDESHWHNVDCKNQAIRSCVTTFHEFRSRQN